MEIKTGVGVYGGIEMAKIRILENQNDAFAHTKCADCIEEFKFFESAKEKALTQLRQLYTKAFDKLGEEHAAIFEVHQMMLEDEDFIAAVERKVKKESYSAPDAVREVGREFSALFLSMEDSYMQAKAEDIRDITGRVLKNMRGAEQPQFQWEEPVILLAQELVPSQIMSFEREKVAAFVIGGGSANSHASILAKSMNIPCIIMADMEISCKYQDTPAIVDGFEGKIYLNPNKQTVSHMMQLREKERMRREELKSVKGKESITLDGKKIKISVNIGGLHDLSGVFEYDAEGVGLFRTEFLYMAGENYPSEEEQFELYKKVVEALGEKTVVIRTLDIGADKKIGYFGLPPEENPALGYRAIRICLDRTDLFKTQLRAIYRASTFGNVSIMFPMIISVEEVLQIKDICQSVREELKREGLLHDSDVPLGIMIETPAAVLISDLLAREVDFFSIGTNDLAQYTLAIDRQNQSLEKRYDPHHLSIMRSLKLVVDHAHKEGIPVGICGELAADLSLTEEFLKLGIDELSVSAPFVLGIREKVRSIDLSCHN